MEQVAKLKVKNWVVTNFLSQKYYYLVGLVLLTLTNYTLTQIPLYFKKAFDIIKENKINLKSDLLWVLSIAVLLAAGSIIFRTLSRTMFFNPARRIEFNIKNQLYKKLMITDQSYFKKTSTGSILSRINNDISYARMVYGFGALQFCNIVLLFSIAPFHMWLISPKLTILCIVPLLLSFLLIRFGIKHILKFFKARSENLQHMSDFALESLNAIDIVKVYQMKDWTRQQFNTRNEALFDSSRGILKWRILSGLLITNIDDIIKVFIFSFAAYSIASSDFSIGDMAAFLAYAAILTGPIGALGWFTTIIRQGWVSLNNLIDIYNQPNRKNTATSPTERELVAEFHQFGLAVDNLNFCYPEDEINTLNNISFTIQSGQTLGLLGRVSSGKTTLVNCLTKMLPVNRGCIKIGRFDINDVREDIWNKILIGITQDPFLFSGTIKENVLLTAEDEKQFSSQKMEEIFERSALKNEINNFMNRELELVGEKGITLSGGQKQRITIARSFVKNSQILILDNVLSAVDYITEDYLIKQILTTKNHNTLIIISHRINGIRNCDNILVLDHGRIVSQGKHKDLLENSAIYKEVWKIQN